MPYRYLSQAWLQRADELASSSTTLRDATSSIELVVEHVVTDGPGGAVTFHIEFAGGSVAVREGPASRPDIRLTQGWTGAEAIARGERSALDAFLAGDLRLGGNTPLLIQHRAALAAIDDVFAPLRAQTTW